MSSGEFGDKIEDLPLLFSNFDRHYGIIVSQMSIKNQSTEGVLRGNRGVNSSSRVWNGRVERRADGRQGREMEREAEVRVELRRGAGRAVRGGRSEDRMRNRVGGGVGEQYGGGAMPVMRKAEKIKPTVRTTVWNGEVEQKEDSWEKLDNWEQKVGAGEQLSAEEFLKPSKGIENLERKEVNMAEFEDLGEIGEVGRKGRKCEKEKASKKEQGGGKKPKRKKLKLVILIIVLGLIGAGAKWADGLVRRITSGKSGVLEVIGAVVNDEVRPLAKAPDGRTNILLFGTSGYNMAGQGNSGMVHDGAGLTDSIMVASFDQNTGDMALLNIPRDLKVGNTCDATGKINALYGCSNAYGKNEAAGAEALKYEVEKVLGIRIQYFGHLNWGALVSLVDTLGGITVTLDETIQDDMTRTYIKQGEAVTLNGEKALGLARARYGTAGGDFSRANSQQKILIAVQQKLREQKIGFNEAMNLVNMLGDNLRTDFKVEEIKTAVKLGAKFDLGKIRQVSLVDYSGENNLVKPATIGGVSYIVPTAGEGEYEEIQKFVKMQFSSDATGREKEKILVLNNSGMGGMASQERGKLEREGFAVVAIGDATGDFTEGERYIYDLSGKTPGKKQLLEKFYGATAKPGAELPAGTTSLDLTQFDLVVIIGKKL